MTKPINITFSIIIPTYNRAKLLKQCIDSVIAQTYTNWEAIIVDNYSIDDTIKIIKSYNDTRIKFIQNHNNGIIAISRNKAIDMANGEWICFLDSDDRWFPNKLEEIYKYTNEYDLIYHGCLNSIGGGLFKRKQNYFYKIKKPELQYILRRGDPINPSCAAVSKLIIGNIRFSENKELAAVEDYDFFLQIIANAKNLRILRLKKILTYYDVSTGISHSIKALDRDRKIYIKYSDFLGKRDLREVIKYYYLRQAEFINSKKAKRQLLKCYWIASTAKAFNVKRAGILGLLKTSFKYLRLFNS